MPDEQNITHSYIIDYIRNTLSDEQGIFIQLEEFAQKNAVPIVQKETSALLKVLCQIKKPKRILEIGTAIGYSAMIMANSLKKDTHIVTIERDADMAKIARKNILEFGYNQVVEVLEGDAQPLLEVLDQKFDLIFLDAAKAHYIYFLPHCLRLLNPGGVLISDNVLYGGMVASRELLIRRKITIVKRLKKYLDALCSEKSLDTCILSTGDGVAVSVKKD